MFTGNVESDKSIASDTRTVEVLADGLPQTVVLNEINLNQAADISSASINSVEINQSSLEGIEKIFVDKQIENAPVVCKDMDTQNEKILTNTQNGSQPIQDTPQDKTGITQGLFYFYYHNFLRIKLFIKYFFL